MLEKLLEEIRAGGTLETTVLANKLGTTPQMIAVMLEHLQRGGFIKNYVKCEDGCDGCGSNKECNIQPQAVRIWQSQPEN